MAEGRTVISAVQHIKNKVGEFVAIFPINTINEVYYDIDKNVKLKTILDLLLKKYMEVSTEVEKLALTPDQVPNGTIIYVTETHTYYQVIDNTKLNTNDGYKETTGGMNAIVSAEDVEGLEDVINDLLSKINGAASSIIDDKLEPGKVLVSDADGNIGVADITAEQLGYLSKLDKPIDEMINSAQVSIDGAASTIVDDKLEDDRVLVSDADGNVAVSEVSSEDLTMLQYLSGVTENVQDQLNGKQSEIKGAATTVVDSDLVANRAVVSNADGKIDVSVTTASELAFLSGIRSRVQTQIDSKPSGLTADVTYYVDPLNGNNNSNGLTASTALMNISTALFKIPKNLGGNIATINIVGGVTIGEALAINGYRNGTLVINVVAGANGSRVVTFTNPIMIMSCDRIIFGEIGNVGASNPATIVIQKAGGYGLYLSDIDIFIAYTALTCVNTASGIVVYGTKATFIHPNVIFNNIPAGSGYCVTSNFSGDVCLAGMSITGTTPGYGLYSGSGSIIKLNAITQGAATVLYSSEGGGRVFVGTQTVPGKY